MTAFEGTTSLAVGTLRGVRGWDVENGRLMGVYGYSWKEGENQATCTRGARYSGELKTWVKAKVAARDCLCGFYAYHSVHNRWVSALKITGVIEGYGLTQIGTEGFRCAKARIVALTVPLTMPHPLRTRRLLRRAYGVPVYFSRTMMLLCHRLGEVPG